MDAPSDAFTMRAAQLRRAAEDGDADTVRELAALLSGAELDFRPDGETPLLLACQSEHRPVVELLCDAGADVSVADDDGWTPLHWAAALASPRLVELLLGAGSPVAAHANCGSTALLFATEVDDCESVRLLLQSGARPTQRCVPAGGTSLRCTSPLALAIAGLPRQEHIEVGRLLAEAAGIADAWGHKEAGLEVELRAAARRRRATSLLGNALDDDVGRHVVSMLPLAGLGKVAQADKRWRSWAAPRLLHERAGASMLGYELPAVARACVLQQLDARSMARLAVADGAWARELARFLSTAHTAFNLWDAIHPYSRFEQLLKGITLRMQAADLVAFLRACKDVHGHDLVDILRDSGSISSAMINVRDRKLGWTPELLVELINDIALTPPGFWTTEEGMLYPTRVELRPRYVVVLVLQHFCSP